MWENWWSVRIYDFLTIKHVLGGKVRIQGKIYHKCLKWKSLSRVQLFGTPWSQRSWPPVLQADSLPAEPPGKPKNTGEGNLFLLQQIFPTLELKWGLLHCRRIFTSWATRVLNTILTSLHLMFHFFLQK